MNLNNSLSIYDSNLNSMFLGQLNESEEIIDSGRALEEEIDEI